MNADELLALSGDLMKVTKIETGYEFHYTDGRIVEVRGTIDSIEMTCLPDPDYSDNEVQS